MSGHKEHSRSVSQTRFCITEHYNFTIKYKPDHSMKHLYHCNKITSRVACTVMACVSLLGWSCVDNEFQLDNISGEITVGSGNATFPLGFLPEKSVSELIGDNVDGLTTDQDGNYGLFYSDYGAMSLGGFDSRYDIAGSSTAWDMEYPELELTNTYHTLNQMDRLSLPSELLPQGTTLPQPVTAEISSTGELDYDFEATVPEQVKKVDRIYFGGSEFGSRIDMIFDLNGLAPLNESGVLTVNIPIPEKYDVRDSTGVAVNGTLLFRRTLTTDTSCRLTYYINSMDTSAAEIANGKLTLNETLAYDISYTMNAKSGVAFDQSNVPTLDFDGRIEYLDADIETGEITIENATNEIDTRISIRNIPKEIISVKSMSFASSELTIFVDGLDWLGRNISDAMTVTAGLPTDFTFGRDAGGYYDPDTHRLSAPMTAFVEGVTLPIESAEFGEEGLIPANGTLGIEIPASVSVGAIPEGTRAKASELTRTGSGSISAGFKPMSIEVVSIECMSDYSSTNNSTINIGTLSDYDINVENFDVSPVITVNVTNSISVALDAALRLVPETDGVPQADKALTVEGITLAAAQYAGGSVEPGVTHLVIADSEPENTEPGTQFKQCDLSSLFDGSIPQSISVEFEAGTDKTKTYTVYAADSYDVTYDYKVDVPLDLGEDFRISYSDILGGLHESVFSELSKFKISVDEIKFFIEVENSTPLNLNVDMVFYDLDGGPSTVKAEVAADNATVYGSEDGTPRSSTVEIGISNPGGTLSTDVLETIDAVGLTLEATSASPGLPLNEAQTLSARMSISVPGGISLDIENLK